MGIFENERIASDSAYEFLDIAKCFQEEEIDTPLLKRFGLFSKYLPRVFDRGTVRCRTTPSGPIEPAIRTSCLAASRASRAILTPR